MAETTTKMTGGCLCGAVRYETTGASFKVLHCHCQSCRKHSGGPVVTLAGFKAGQVKFSGDGRNIYQSSPGVGRAFCGKCGTPLTWEGDGGDLGPILEFNISTFDDPSSLKPILHSFDSDRIAWFEVADNLPRYQGLSEKSPLLRHGPAIHNEKTRTMSLAKQLTPAQRSIDPKFGVEPAPHKIGVIALSSDVVTERDFSLMLPSGGEVMFYTTRVPLELPVTVKNLRLMGPKLSEASSLILPTSELDVIAYSCTSASVLIGPGEIRIQVQRGRPDVEVVTPISAATAAFEICDVKRISLLTPYTEEVTKAMATFIGDQGVEVLNFAYFDLVDDQEMARLTPDVIHDAAVEIAHPDADAVFVSCTGVRTTETINRLEETLGKPAFCSNQCMFWQSLRLSGYDKPIAGFGRLLTL